MFHLQFLFLKYEKKYIWAATWQNQHCGCVPSKDQPGHPPSLIRVFAVHMKKPWVLSYPLSVQRRLWSDWADSQADLSLGWAHTHFVGFVMLWLIYPFFLFLYPFIPFIQPWKERQDNNSMFVFFFFFLLLSVDSCAWKPISPCWNFLMVKSCHFNSLHCFRHANNMLHWLV